MVIFSLVFLKIISVLLSVLIGFFAGRYSNVDRDSIASLLFYFIAPIVFFSIPASANLTLSTLSITLLSFIMATILSIIGFYFSNIYWKDSTRNIIALSSGTANIGYFTLPIAAALFDDYTLSIYTMALMGVAIYESSIGFYICAKSLSSTKNSIMRVLKLPILHGFTLGCIFSYNGFVLPHFLDDFVASMRGTFSIFGMIIVGLGVSKLEKFTIDFKFTVVAFITKFLFYPIAINIFIIFDKIFTNWYDVNYYNALQLVSTAPMAANVIVIASLQKLHPEKVATTVLLSLLFCLIYMPIMSVIFLSDVNTLTNIS